MFLDMNFESSDQYGVNDHQVFLAMPHCTQHQWDAANNKNQLLVSWCKVDEVWQAV